MASGISSTTGSGSCSPPQASGATENAKTMLDSEEPLCPCSLLLAHSTQVARRVNQGKAGVLFVPSASQAQTIEPAIPPKWAQPHRWQSQNVARSMLVVKQQNGSGKCDNTRWNEYTVR